MNCLLLSVALGGAPPVSPDPHRGQDQAVIRNPGLGFFPPPLSNGIVAASSTSTTSRANDLKRGLYPYLSCPSITPANRMHSSVLLQ